MSKTQDYIKEGFEHLSKANIAMLNAIVNEVKEKGVVVYEDYVEPEKRYIKYNEDGDLAMCDECDNSLVLVEDLSADDLYGICIQIAEF